jgi:hypothetical protein
MGISLGRAGALPLKKRGSPVRSGFAFAFSPNCPALSPPSLPRSCSSAFRRRGCHGHAGLSRSLPDRGGARHSAPLAWMGHACVCWEDPGRHHSPRRSRRWGVCALRFQSLLRVGAADFVVLSIVAGGARASTLGPHTPLHSPGGHLCPLL